MRARVLVIAEAAALVALVVLAWWLGGVATDAWLRRAGELGLDAPDGVRDGARTASVYFSLGVGVLAAARAISLRRGREPLAVPWILPALVAACLLGLVVHHATVEVAAGALRRPTAPGFAQGFLIGCVAAAAILIAPVDLAAWATRLRAPIAIAIFGIFGALAVAGSGPAGSGTRINLGPIQPIEIIKPLAILFLAAFLGARAGKLRWQRRRFAGLRWPRLELLIPAAGVLVLIVAGLFVIGDLGPVLLLAFVFLAMFYLVSRATGWAVLALAIVGVVFAILARWPGVADVGTIKTRLHMWQDPWTNGMTNGHQLGDGLWAISAGGGTGQGLAANATPLVPAGKTDLVLATMTEQLGAAGLVGYQLLLAAIVLGGLYVAARSRTAERVLIAGGVAILLVVQWAVIQAGTLGQMPLTGIVVPFVSTGRSSMVAFVALVALVVRLAEDARPRAASTELDELHAGARSLAIAAGVLLAFGAVTGVRAALDPDVSARGIVVRLADGTRLHRQNPRLLAIATQIRRGTIADRHGAPLAVSAGGTEYSPGAGGTEYSPGAGGTEYSPGVRYGVPHTRTYPLGAAMGTLVGTSPSPVLLPSWALERVFEHRLRGHGERAGRPPGLPWPDLRAYVPVLALHGEARRARIAAIDADLDARSVRLTIDAGLQGAVAKLLAASVAKAGRLAAAAVVIDVDTGEVLARVQVPDYDPNAPDWQSRVLDGDADYLARFHGAYGSWPDKTGVQGMFQAGSVAKLFTAIAAVRADAGGATYRCDEADADGPYFTMPGWTRPIHDHFDDPTHGGVDLAEAIAVSCNVYFGQLGLALGPARFAELRADGLDVGYGDDFAPGAAGSRQLASTAFGQGAMALNVVQAARLTAAIAGGGHYRRCPPTLALDAPCIDTVLVAEPAALAPVIAGMRRVMTGGTGRRLTAPVGVRVYGKTGTADGRGFVGEAAFGIPAGADAPPHSWFVAFAEPAASPDGALVAPGRLAVAVVVPRGGVGAWAAGTLAMQILDAARAQGYLGGP